VWHPVLSMCVGILRQLVNVDKSLMTNGTTSTQASNGQLSFGRMTFGELSWHQKRSGRFYLNWLFEFQFGFFK
jgi:hypothetical protein